MSEIKENPAMTTTTLQPGKKVRVIQTIRTREGMWRTQIEGEVVTFNPQPTGSWFAHGKNDKYWLPRLRLKRADGEIVDLIIDDESEIKPVD